MTSTKLLAVLGILVGGIGTILGLLTAFGVTLTADQNQAIVGAGGLLLLIVSAWLHPDVPVGPTGP